MLKKYQELHSELSNRASKRSRISGKQLLVLIREFTYYSSLASDYQWVLLILQIAKGAADSEAELKMFRVCWYLITSSLLYNDWTGFNDQRQAVIVEANLLANDEMKHSSGSKACLLIRSLGSLTSPSATSHSASIVLTGKALVRLWQMKGAQKKLPTQLELQTWRSYLSALRRTLDFARETGESCIPTDCIEALLSGSASADASVSRHSTALLLIVAKALSITDGDKVVEMSLLANNVLSLLCSFQSEKDFANVQSVSNFIQLVAVLSIRKGVSKSCIIGLNSQILRLLRHPVQKVFADVVHHLLRNSRAKSIVSAVQLTDKLYREKSVISTMASQCLSRLSSACADMAAGKYPYLTLPCLLRAAAEIGRFSCDCCVRYTEITVLDNLWKEILDLIDSLSIGLLTQPHIILDALTAAVWVTQSGLDTSRDVQHDEGYQWLALTDRIDRAVPLLGLNGDSVLPLALLSSVLERCKQYESSSVLIESDSNDLNRRGRGGDTVIFHHSLEGLRLLIATGESVVRHYPSQETATALASVWTYVAQFTIPPSSDAIDGQDTSRAVRRVYGDVLDTSDLVPPSTSPLTPPPTFALSILDLSDPQSALSTANRSACSAEQTVHAMLHSSLSKALQSELFLYPENNPYPSVPHRRHRDREGERVADLRLKRDSLWHLAEHAILLPSADKEVKALVKVLIQYVSLGSDSMRMIAANGLLKIAGRLCQVASSKKIAGPQNVPKKTDALQLLLTAPQGDAATIGLLGMGSQGSDDASPCVWAGHMTAYVMHDIAVIVGDALGLTNTTSRCSDRTQKDTDRISYLVSSNTPYSPLADSLVQYVQAERHTEVAMTKSDKSKASMPSSDTSTWRKLDASKSSPSPSPIVEHLWSGLVQMSPSTSESTNTSTVSVAPRGSESSKVSSVSEKERGRGLFMPRQPVRVTTKRPPSISPFFSPAAECVSPVPTSSLVSSKKLEYTPTRLDFMGNSSFNANSNSNSLFGFMDDTAVTTSEAYSPPPNPPFVSSEAVGGNLDFLTTPVGSRNASINLPDTVQSFVTDSTLYSPATDNFTGFDFTASKNGAAPDSAVEPYFPPDWLDDIQPAKTDPPVKSASTTIFSTTAAEPDPLYAFSSSSAFEVPIRMSGDAEGFRMRTRTRSSSSESTSDLQLRQPPPRVTDSRRNTPTISKFRITSSSRDSATPTFANSSSEYRTQDYPSESDAPNASEASQNHNALFSQSEKFPMPFAASSSSNPSPSSSSAFSASLSASSFEPSKPTVNIDLDFLDLENKNHQGSVSQKIPSPSFSSSSSSSSALARNKVQVMALKPPTVKSLITRKPSKPTMREAADLLNLSAPSPFDAPSPFLSTTATTLQKTDPDPFGPAFALIPVPFSASTPDLFAATPTSASIATAASASALTSAAFTPSIADPFTTPFTATQTKKTYATTIPQYPLQYPYPNYPPGADPRMYYPPGPYSAPSPHAYHYQIPLPQQGFAYVPPQLPQPGATYSTAPGGWQQTTGSGPIPIGVNAGTAPNVPAVDEVNPFDQFLKK